MIYLLEILQIYDHLIVTLLIHELYEGFEGHAINRALVNGLPPNLLVGFDESKRIL